MRVEISLLAATGVLLSGCGLMSDGPSNDAIEAAIRAKIIRNTTNPDVVAGLEVTRISPDGRCAKITGPSGATHRCTVTLKAEGVLAEARETIDMKQDADGNWIGID